MLLVRPTLMFLVVHIPLILIGCGLVAADVELVVLTLVGVVVMDMAVSPLDVGMPVALRFF